MVLPGNGAGGNGKSAYQCLSCSSMVTYSDRLTAVGGATRHLFRNPSGIECDFLTFSSCPGAIEVGIATEQYTWFPGYRWTVALCRSCGDHLGWYYESIADRQKPHAFWGMLASHLSAARPAGG